MYGIVGVDGGVGIQIQSFDHSVPQPPSVTLRPLTTPPSIHAYVQVGLHEFSEALEAKIGGRVSPMIYLPGNEHRCAWLPAKQAFFSFFLFFPFFFWASLY